MTVNVPLLRKVVSWAEEQAALPGIECRWRQESWLTPADTVADDLARDSLSIWADTEEVRTVATALEPHCGSAFCIAGYVGQLLDPRYGTAETVDDVHVSQFAADALGISADVAESSGGLFFGFNTIEQVRSIAERLAGEKL